MPRWLTEITGWILSATRLRNAVSVAESQWTAAAITTLARVDAAIEKMQVALDGDAEPWLGEPDHRRTPLRAGIDGLVEARATRALALAICDHYGRRASGALAGLHRAEAFRHPPTDDDQFEVDFVLHDARPLESYLPVLAAAVAEAARTHDERPITALSRNLYIDFPTIDLDAKAFWAQYRRERLERHALPIPSPVAATGSGASANPGVGEAHEAGEPESAMEGEAATQKRAPTVFVVHGHDESTLDKVQNLLLRIGCRPVTFKRLASKGAKTNIEILEETLPECAAVIVLLTPDDEGRKKAARRLQPRARQNVLVEAGYAVIQRRSTSIIVALGDIEIPSDLDGINRVQRRTWDAEGELDLARRLKGQGLSVDLAAV